MKLSLSFLVLLLSFQLLAQLDENPIITSIPFLEIHPDPQVKGIANIGVVSSEYNTQAFIQNPAQLTQENELIGFQVNHMPWLGVLGLNWRFFEGGAMISLDKQAIGLNYKYFSLGELQFRNGNGVSTPSRGREIAFSGHYAYQLTKHLSLGLGLKFFSSHLADDLMIGLVTIQPADGFSADLGAVFKNKKELNAGKQLYYQIGMSVTNIGPKISYVADFSGDFIPTTLRLGYLLGFKKRKNDQLSLAYNFRYQLQKMLVPTPVFEDENNNGSWDYTEQGMASAIFSSFGDAPGGAKEEWHELIHQLGIESWLIIKNKYRIGFRGGLFLENEHKGNRRLATIGISGAFKEFYMDVGLIKSMSSLIQPLDNTVSFGIGYRKILNSYWEEG